MLCLCCCRCNPISVLDCSRGRHWPFRAASSRLFRGVAWQLRMSGRMERLRHDVYQTLRVTAGISTSLQSCHKCLSQSCSGRFQDRPVVDLLRLRQFQDCRQERSHICGGGCYELGSLRFWGVRVQRSGYGDQPFCGFGGVHCWGSLDHQKLLGAYLGRGGVHHYQQK